MLKKRRKLVKLAETQGLFDLQIDELLEKYGFPADADYRRMAATFIQNLSGNDLDYFDPEELVGQIRLARAKHFAYFVIFPSKREKAAVEVVNEVSVEAPTKVE